MNSKTCSVALGALFVVMMPQYGWAQDQEGELLGGTLSGNVMFSSDYVFRGITQTKNLPQIQGDLTWSHGSGVYTGIWASNTNFGGGDASMEFDPYIGFSRGIADTGLSYDIGYWSYNYPGGDELNYWEVYGILSYETGSLGLSGSVWYADNYFGDDFFDDVSSLAYDATVSYQLNDKWLVSARVGQQTFDETAGLADQDYLYYDVGASMTWQDYTLALRWHDSDGVEPELATESDSDGSLVFSLTRSF